MNKRQMKKQAKINSGRKLVETTEGLKLVPAKEIYLEEDVYFGDELNRITTGTLDFADVTVTNLENVDGNAAVQYVNDHWNELLEANDKEERIEFVKKNGVISIDGNLARTGTTVKGERIELDGDVTKVAEYPETTRFDEVGLSEKTLAEEQVIHVTSLGTTEEEKQRIKECMDMIKEHEKQLAINKENEEVKGTITVENETYKFEPFNLNTKPVEKVLKEHGELEGRKQELEKEEILSKFDNILNEHLYAEPEKPKGLIAKIKSFFKKG